MENITLETLYNNFASILEQDAPKQYITVIENTEVIYGDVNTCNVEYCSKNNISCYDGSANDIINSGTIVFTPGNIHIVSIADNKEWLAQKFINSLMDYFKTKGINETIETDNNDILINGYKVASGVEFQYKDSEGDWAKTYFAYQISINQDIETIKNVCNKPMVKIPKGLNDYGITTEEIKKFCEDYFLEH